MDIDIIDTAPLTAMPNIIGSEDYIGEDYLKEEIEAIEEIEEEEILAGLGKTDDPVRM